MKNNITMSVVSSATYLQEQSVVESNRFLWSYEMTITNQSDQIVQLLSRYWRIVDMMGHVEEVRGPGVLGLQPIIKPGKSFTYTSFCQLMTPHGEMEGNYTLQTLDEVNFIITIPKLILSSSESITAAFRSRLH
ncbi:MAG: Co2+/Mg2+ efflux protein ApaG [Gammaproteobacteria bacterium]|nr:Co2+/Mg2+ efflux protein ApaG [Gammaproteobacteria bacterium]